ncbi:hypothetical protein QNE44_004865 [Vibrio harveyi]|uniref:hypothetical protein n=1 Tax=Vibrio harveyi group TaxID=717610 RepID=UPI001F249496|nr:hypothetical protein [Vibrio parahaemolyticus]EKY4197767.1 hypothetical protein [Vibrio harveyi]ELV8724687.1 hypothetical protein [Vibrio harveyi]MCG0025058.1 hypothetical protein [Vibrio parahaemolyticus]MDF4462255.1 hypothetical protein [Vibrio parahaemolyticus]MDF4466987.1 hypothetical protein [Vibrio parahaemolyticus]
MFKNIHLYFVPEELNLLRAFNRKQIEFVDGFVENIEQHIETYTDKEFVQQWAGDEGEVVEVEKQHIAGITEDEYDFKDIFTSVMPMYQRQSMLLTAWSMFENEIHTYYSRLALKVGAEPNLRKIKRAKHSSDLAHVIACLQSLGVVAEPTKQFLNAFERLNNEVRLVRIDWVHNGGRAVKSEFVEHTNGLTMNCSQIDISVDYIEEVTDLMWLLSTEITESARVTLGGS